nr:MAG: RNA-dependent RNA polymerase [Aspergillus flavus vivivirus 1]
MASVFSGNGSERSESRFSVGETMRRGGTTMAQESSRFRAMSAKLTQRVREQVAEEQQRRAEAQAMLVPYAVEKEVIAGLQQRYPEFSVLGLALEAVVHADLEAERMMATALSLERLQKFSSTVLSLGNSVLISALTRARGIHNEMSSHDAYAVHANHTAQSIFHRLARNRQALLNEYGLNIDSVAYRDFIRGRAFQVCDEPAECASRTGAYFADLSIYPMSVKQVCAGMASAGAAIGQVMLPYSPEMLVHTQGPWANTGVHYELTFEHLLLKYTEGVAGTTRFELGAWVEWLRSGAASVRCGDKEVFYQVELESIRGPFLFITLTKVDEEIPADALSFRTHALELPVVSDRYFVRTFRLKSLALDPTKRSSYEMYCYTPDKRLCDKVFAHAMSLSKDQFKDARVLKRVTVLDGRITFAGMSVALDRPVSMEMVSQLTQDIVLRAFVARYNMGELGADLMAQLNSVQGFAAAGTLAKVAYLSCALVKCAWDWTGDVLVRALRNVVETGLRWLTGRGRRVVPEFLPAPSFVTFETYTSWLSSSVYSRMAGGTGSNLVVPFLRGSREAYRAHNRLVPQVLPNLPRITIPRISYAMGGLHDEIEDTREDKPVSEQGSTLVDTMHELNGMSESPAGRFDVELTTVAHKGEFDFGPEDFIRDDNFIKTINDVHERAFPGMGLQQFEADNASLHYDPQARTVVADYLRFPLVGQRPPDAIEVYKSRLRTYQVERRVQTLQQLLVALEARNLAVPQIAEPQDINGMVLKTWDNFLDMCCKPEAKAMVEQYRADVVGFEKEALEEWTKKANPAKIKSMLRELETEAKSVEEYSVADFDVMVKSDAKPPLSVKPITEQLAPQVIVYHKPVLSAAYSSIFRVLTRRFLSLLKPEWMVNLLKDTEAVRKHLSELHPWGEQVEFLENDFSKYDKSQSELCVRLEHFVYRMLGMDKDLLATWYKGHERSRLHSVQLALTLMIDWQRRSGGGNTAFGNVLVNLMTTAYVYRGSQVCAAVYIGDDSLLVCKRMVASKASVQALGDIFNLQAKFIATRAPYFASNFVLFDEDQREALLVPDPFKRAQRLGLSVNAVNPEWDDRVRSHHENCRAYKYRKVQAMLAPAVRSRYDLGPEVDVEGLLNALATSAETFENTRGCWESEQVRVDI